MIIMHTAPYVDPSDLQEIGKIIGSQLFKLIEK